jgi:hypothetical protein
VLHLRYTAREGGDPLRAEAVANLKAKIAKAEAAGSVRLLSLRNDFPTEWARFKAAELDSAAGQAPLTFALCEEHYPFWARAVQPIDLHAVDLFAQPASTTKPTVTITRGQPDDENALVTVEQLGGLRIGSLSEPLPDALGEVRLSVDDNSMTDLWLAVAWGARRQDA